MKKFYIFLFFLPLVFCVNGQDYTWLDSRVSKVNTLDLEDSNFDDLQALKKSIGQSSIVFLGEHTHGEGNEYEAKARLVKFLHEEMNFEVIAFESGLYDLWKANREIKKGVSVKEAFHNSVFNIWTLSQQFHPLLQYLENHSKEFEFVGFDSQFSSSYAPYFLAAELAEFFKKNDVTMAEERIDYLDGLVNSLSESALPSDFDSVEFKVVYKEVIQKLDLIKTDTQAKDFWRQNLKSMVTLISAVKIYNQKTEETFRAKDSNIRDAQMADNLIFLSTIYPNKKIICWGATPHFVNKPSALENEEMKEYHPMGEYVKEKLGDEEVYILAFVTAGGSYGAVFEDETEVPIPQADALEFRLDKMGDDFAFVDLKNLSTQESWTTSAIEHEPIKGKWQEVVDGFFYIKKVTRCTLATGTKVSEEATENDTDNYVIINGTITDQESKEGMPYVHVFVESTSIGVVSNERGAFEIKIPSKYKSNNLVFSTIAYRTVKKQIQKLKPNTIISLVQIERILDAVVVTAKMTTAKDLVMKASNAIQKNYLQKPFNYTIYYSGNEFDSLTMTNRGYEAAFEAYYNLGYAPKSAHSFSILNKRSSTSRASKKHKFVMHWPFLGLNTDYALEQRRYLNKKSMDKYEFQISDIISTDSSFIYEVSFKALKTRKKYVDFGSVKTYGGKIYIQDTDFAIVKLEENYVFKAQDKKNIQRVAFSLNTSYRKYGTYYFASYSTFNSLHALPIKENSSPHLVKGKHELLIVNINTKSPQPFINAVWDINKVPYDKSFWENFNTIKKNNKE